MENMGVEKQRVFEEKEICVSDHINGLQYTSTKSDNFVVDMERFTHIIEKDINANSRITLQRNLSRKGSFRSGERKTNSNAVNEKDTSFTASSPRGPKLQRNLSRKGSFRSGERKTNSNAVNEKDTSFTASSPRASSLLGGGSTPEKHMSSTSSSDQHTQQTNNHQITIVAGHGGATTTESKIGGRRFSFRRSTNWTIDPRRILLFFATLSSMGTMLLIYFTLSIAKLNGEDIADLNG